MSSALQIAGNPLSFLLPAQTQLVWDRAPAVSCSLEEPGSFSPDEDAAFPPHSITQVPLFPFQESPAKVTSVVILVTVK